MSVSKDLTVQASVGLHARPAAEFVKLSLIHISEPTRPY